MQFLAVKILLKEAKFGIVTKIFYLIIVEDFLSEFIFLEVSNLIDGIKAHNRFRMDICLLMFLIGFFTSMFLGYFLNRKYKGFNISLMMILKYIFFLF